MTGSDPADRPMDREADAPKATSCHLPPKIGGARMPAEAERVSRVSEDGKT